MEQNREPRNKLMHIQSINLYQKSQEYTMRKDSLFGKLCWEYWIATCKRMKFDDYLTSCTKTSSEWFKDLVVRPRTINLGEKKVDGKLFGIGLGNEFLNLTQKAKATKEKINW